jgi:hypothetical protein
LDEPNRKPPPQRGRGGRPRKALLAPDRKLTWAETLDIAASVVGSQLLALKAAAEERGLEPREQQWLADLVDRCALIEGQRVRLVLAALASEQLTVEQRSAIIQSLTGVTPMPAQALEEVKP